MSRKRDCGSQDGEILSPPESGRTFPRGRSAPWRLDTGTRFALPWVRASRVAPACAEAAVFAARGAKGAAAFCEYLAQRCPPGRPPPQSPPDLCASDRGHPGPCSAAAARSPLAHARSRSAEQRDRPVPPTVSARGPAECSAASGTDTVGFLRDSRCGDRGPVVPPHFGSAVGSQVPSVSTEDPRRDGGSGRGSEAGPGGVRGAGSRRGSPVPAGRPRSVPAGVPAGGGGAAPPARAVAAIRAGQSALTGSPGPRHRFLICSVPPPGGAVATGPRTAFCPALAGPSRGHCPLVTLLWPLRGQIRPSAVLARSAAGGTETSRLDGVQEYPATFPFPRPTPYSSRFLPLPIRKQIVFMFLQIMSKFRTPGNKSSFVRSARSLERAINGAPRPPALGSGAFPARAVRGDPRNCSAGADEGLRVCDGTPGTRRAGALPSGLSVGAPRMGPRGDSAVQCRQSGGSGHAAPKNRWLQDTRGPLPRAKLMRETPLRSWVCAPGKNGGFSPCVGTAEGKNPALRPGAWHGSRGLLRALRPAEPAVRGGCPGRRGRQCPPGVAGTPPVAQRRQPPFPGGRCHLWKAPGIHRAGEDAPGSAAFLCGTVGTRPARARRFPGGAVEHQRGFGRHGPQYRLPGGGCAARSRGGGGTRPGTGAELHLPGPVVSPTGQSLRNRAITIEGAERSSSAQVLTGVPEAGILSLPLCPSTPRSLRSSASPLRSPELKGSNRTRCRPRRWPALSHVHGGTLPPVTTSPPEPPGKPCPVMNSMSNTSTRKLTLTGISGVLWAVGIAAAWTHPRSLLLGPDTPALPGSNPGGTVGYRCRRSEQLPSCPRAARKRKGSVSGAGLGPPLGQDREPAVPVVPRGPGSSPPPSAQPGECPRKQGARVESGSGARSALRGEWGPCSDRPGDGDTLGRDHVIKGSLRRTGILGHPGNRLGSGWEL
ncbi:collagen alpha-1(II) chain-like [Corvus moneduloides]|uniref:collagen alpha-1(II) chain-like n=1 Tax=Corvus moneduloides TaxID=1196302 RepID=UPI0013622AE6|nr:collagen alpha-1(II) chain-like [Corvus moneduloides]